MNLKIYFLSSKNFIKSVSVQLRLFFEGLDARPGDFTLAADPPREELLSAGVGYRNLDADLGDYF